MTSSIWMKIWAVLAIWLLAEGHVYASQVDSIVDQCEQWAGEAHNGRHQPGRKMLNYDFNGEYTHLSEQFNVDMVVSGFGSPDRLIKIKFQNDSKWPRYVSLGMLAQIKNGDSPSQLELDGQIPFRTIERLVHSIEHESGGELSFCFRIERTDLDARKALVVNFFHNY